MKPHQGGLMVLTQCDGCPKEFWKRLTEILRRSSTDYCSAKCYRRNIDYRALGKIGGAAPKKVDPAVKFSRSSMGGHARARNCSKERLTEIGKHANVVKMRVTTPEQRTAAARIAGAKGNETRWGARRLRDEIKALYAKLEE